jgi:predicted metal-dependent hydrolase
LKFDIEVNPILEFISNHPKALDTREYAFSQAIDFYNRKKYFEAHEILEFQWKKEQGNQKIFLQALIQISVAMNKVFVNVNLVGALSQARLALEKLSFLKSSNVFSEKKSTRFDALMENLRKLIGLIERNELNNSDYAPPELLSEFAELLF